MARLRYLLDENIPHAVRDQLLRHEPEMEILTMGDGTAPALGTPDPAILAWIERHAAILISRNRRSIPKHLQEHLASGHHVPGIFLLRHRSGLGQVIADLLLIWRASAADDYQDRIEYLPL